MKALITGSGGLVGSACANFLAEQGWQVVGIDNDLRREFFGPEASTRLAVDDLVRRWPCYRHHDVDIRDRQRVRDLLRDERLALLYILPRSRPTTRPPPSPMTTST